MPKRLISIDWARIRQTPAGRDDSGKVSSAQAPCPAIPGLELLDDIDRVLISSPGKNSRRRFRSAVADPDSHPWTLRLGQGARSLHPLGAKPQSYNSFQVYRPQGRSEDRKDTAWVLFDAETILFGDAPSIFAALDRNHFASASPPSWARGRLHGCSRRRNGRRIRILGHYGRCGNGVHRLRSQPCSAAANGPRKRKDSKRGSICARAWLRILRCAFHRMLLPSA